MDMEMTESLLQQEFDRQVATLVQKKYHAEMALSEKEFLDLLQPLKGRLSALHVAEADYEKGYLPFVIVIRHRLLPTAKAMSLVERDGKNGIVKLFPLEPEDFGIVDEVFVPESDVYLLVDIDRGKDSLNMPPSEAAKLLTQRHRSPLTIDEGVAIVTHFPTYLRKNNCFSLLASRTGKDQRVPALWINAKKEPNLGWCWNGNPHTWLGSASCKSRLT